RFPRQHVAGRSIPPAAAARRPSEGIAVVAARLSVAAHIAGTALALLHHLARHRLGSLAQRIERIALVAERGIAAALAQRARGILHRLAGLAEGLRCVHALLAEAAHQFIKQLAQGALPLRQRLALLALLRPSAIGVALLGLAALARHAHRLIHEL